MTKHPFRTTHPGKKRVKKEPELPHKLLLKSIENEINSGFMFVAVARSAYRGARPSDGDSALAKAEAIHAKASQLAETVTGAESEMLSERLEELRLAIEQLRQALY
jgi:hypothetical protein